MRRHMKRYGIRPSINQKYADINFKNRYSFTKANARVLIELVRPNLQEHASNTGLPVSIENRILIALRYYARGQIQNDNADLHGISQATVSRIIYNISVAVARLMPQYVKFPPEEGRLPAMRKFHDIAHFPQVIGAIDGTHIPIKYLGGEDAQVCINRKDGFL